MESQTTSHEKREALQRVLSSAGFTRAPGLSRFLSYVCNEILEGRRESLKEYSIAVEALGRSEDFDPKRDSIVRVQATRLRKKLQEFYESDRCTHEFKIVLPEGSYVPEFVAAETHNAAVVEQAGPETIAEPDARRPAAVGATGQRRHLRLSLLVFAAGLLCLVITLVWNGSGRLNVPKRPTERRPIAASNGASAGAVDGGWRLLAGRGASRHMDLNGNLWEGDCCFSGGSVVLTPSNIAVHGYDPDLFSGSRRGYFSYNLPLASGLYELHLYFAETEFGQNSLLSGADNNRVFDIRCNGTTVAYKFDIYADAGDSNRADELIVPGVQPGRDGLLHLDFVPRMGEALVNAIEVIPTGSSKMRPIRIVCSGAKHKGPHGTVWQADSYVRGGEMVTRGWPTLWPSDPDLGRGERYGTFDYQIPVAPGMYTVNLFFTEGWFGTNGPTTGGVGSRVFNVAVNHKRVLTNFDIIREAGGPYRMLKKSFAGVRANGRNKITLDFEPIANYASLNAIEVLPE